MASQGKRLSEHDRQRIAQLRQNLTVREVAKRIDVNKSTVQKYAGKNSGNNA